MASTLGWLVVAALITLGSSTHDRELRYKSI